MAWTDRSVARVVGPVCGIGRGLAVARCADRTTPQGSQRAAQCKGTGMRIKPGPGWGYGSPVPCPEKCMIVPPSTSRMPRGPDVGGAARQAETRAGAAPGCIQVRPAGRAPRRSRRAVDLFRIPPNRCTTDAGPTPSAADCSHRQQKNRTTEPLNQRSGTTGHPVQILRYPFPAAATGYAGALDSPVACGGGMDRALQVSAAITGAYS